MEKIDLDLIEQHRKGNYQLDRLTKDHQALEAEIEALEKTKGLSAEDEKKLHNLKKVKLEGRDQLEEILKTLR